MVELALQMYTVIVEYAVPIAVVFSIGNLIVTTMLRVAFGGKLYFGGGK